MLARFMEKVRTTDINHGTSSECQANGQNRLEYFNKLESSNSHYGLWHTRESGDDYSKPNADSARHQSKGNSCAFWDILYCQQHGHVQPKAGLAVLVEGNTNSNTFCG